MNLRIDARTASGTFSLDGQTFDVENNVFALGDDDECLLVDAPHDLEALAAVVGTRRVVAVVCTHAHDDHVRVAPDAGERFAAPLALHHDDLGLWTLTHPAVAPTELLSDGQVLTVAGTEVHVLHTPGHSPGSICLYVPALETLFTGDTLFAGGPGRPAARSAASRRSSTRSATGCWRCRRPRRCCPVTGSPRRSATRRRTCRSGSTGATDPRSS